jgi:DNA-binding beta-propeller fold protein YncE
MKYTRILIGLFAVGLIASAPISAHAVGNYKLLKTINLPGDKGGHGDWATFDPETQTVWLSQSPDHNVVVIDATTNTVKAVIPGIKDGNGIAISPQYAFLSDNGSNVTVVVDKRTFRKVATLEPVGKGPNGTSFVASTGDVYISSDSNDMTVFKATPPFTKMAIFKLQPNPSKDGPDVALYVPSKDKLYQPDEYEVDLIDPHANKVLAVWQPGIKGSGKPMVYDAKTNHFILGTTDRRMLVLDGDTGSVVTAIPVKGPVDETVIDEGLRRAYVGDKAGVIEVIDLDTNRVVETLPSEKNVHTLAVDPVSHAVYVYRNESNKVDVFAPAG